MKKQELKSELAYIKWLCKQGLENSKIASIVSKRRKSIKEFKENMKRVAV